MQDVVSSFELEVGRERHAVKSEENKCQRDARGNARDKVRNRMLGPAGSLFSNIMICINLFLVLCFRLFLRFSVLTETDLF